MSECRPRLLVVDDDPDVREVLNAVFVDEGFLVAAAGDESAAMSLIETQAFPLVIMDIRLAAGQDGRAIVQWARRSQPDLKTLYISGGPGGLPFDPDLDGFISKPFKPREVIGCVWELYYREPRRKPSGPSLVVVEDSVREGSHRA
jgi:two-component system OmpR family response regulator